MSQEILRSVKDLKRVQNDSYAADSDGHVYIRTDRANDLWVNVSEALELSPEDVIEPKNSEDLRLPVKVIHTLDDQWEWQVAEGRSTSEFNGARFLR